MWPSLFMVHLCQRFGDKGYKVATCCICSLLNCTGHCLHLFWSKWTSDPDFNRVGRRWLNQTLATIKVNRAYKQSSNKQTAYIMPSIKLGALLTDNEGHYSELEMCVMCWQQLTSPLCAWAWQVETRKIFMELWCVFLLLIYLLNLQMLHWPWFIWMKTTTALYMLRLKTQGSKDAFWS